MPDSIADIQKHLRERLTIYYFINHQMRLDLQRFLGAFHKFDTLDSPTMLKVREYFKFHVTTIHAHWHNQEEHFFPTISRFFPAEQMRGSGEMIDDRRALTQLQEKINTAWDDGKKDEITALIKEYAVEMESFAKKEEQFMAKTMLTVKKEQLDAIEKVIIDEQTPSEMKDMLPWVLESMDEEARKYVLARIPKPAVWWWRLFMKRKFERRLEVFAGKKI